MTVVFSHAKKPTQNETNKSWILHLRCKKNTEKHLSPKWWVFGKMGMMNPHGIKSLKKSSPEKKIQLKSKRLDTGIEISTRFQKCCTLIAWRVAGRSWLGGMDVDVCVSHGWGFPDNRSAAPEISKVIVSYKKIPRLKANRQNATGKPVGNTSHLHKKLLISLCQGAKGRFVIF